MKITITDPDGNQRYIIASLDEIRTAIKYSVLEVLLIDNGHCLLIDPSLKLNGLYINVCSELIGRDVFGPVAFIERDLVYKLIFKGVNYEKSIHYI